MAGSGGSRTIHRVGSVGSTQDIAHELARDGAAHGTTVIAERQEAGRGTRGRGWSSGLGGLWLSMVLRPTTPLAIEGLSIRIGLAVAAALDSVLPIGASVQLKWPNDLFGQNRKLGGVLCEARWIGERLGWVVAGVGINVANGIGPDLALGAVRLVDLGGPANPEGLERLVGDVVDEASALGGMLSDHELKAFARRDWLLGRRILGPVSGIAAGLQADGRLLVRQPDGTSQAVFGPVVVGDLAQPRPSH